MSKIKIVTDSTADLPLDIIKELAITVVPLKVNFDKETFLEGKNLSSQDFYKKLSNSDRLPTTSQPSPGDFAAIYDGLAQEGAEEIISIHLSKKLSGTYQSALIAKNMLESKVNVKVIDSQLVSMGLGLIVINAARAIKAGKNSEDVCTLISEIQQKMNTYFVVDTLEFLQKGGRIGKASSLVGTLLNIKPILTITSGEAHPYEKIRGKGKALQRIIEITNQNVDREKIQCAITHSNSLDIALKLHEKIQSQLNFTEIFISDIGAVVGTHVGPGTVAFMYHTIFK
ncbi:MAG: DegV family protein [Peptococcales bacterium]|jgi:DegV family protein with EDD domain